MNEQTKKKSYNNVIAIIIIIVFVFSILLSSYIYYNYCNFKKLSVIEILYYSGQIIGSIFVTVGVIIAVFQYYLSSKSNKTNLEMIKIQKAVELSKYYKDEILSYSVAIKYIYEKAGALSILDKIPINKIKYFTNEELNQFLTANEIDQLKNIASSDKFVEAALEANEIYNLGFNPNRTISAIDKENNDLKTMQVYSEPLIVVCVARLITKVLNNMEYFALNFSHNSADESVVYQSLHQSYFDIVHILYYQIAIKNTDPTEKLYTNVSWLFNCWMDVNSQKKLTKNMKSSEFEHHGTVIEN